MAKATRKRGFQYFGVADHSQSAHYVRRTLARRDRGAAPRSGLNKSFGKEFRILKGIESDILAEHLLGT
ncbi:hypothetical protein CQ12_28785 [Bradyrhizobium jicamae]|uniref:Uncharacterized protein n=1 Tax=Bradyrhizobium jicamae TaxID=280332 RepID=A0A0R3MAL4_9BRAD|nr:hypothetical protein CQ12_28785 [Bradyrhizobium jicamae]